ncbi:MAG: L-threonylcarbamoyladenylate synthase [Nitriliruptoraceae bacterium]
MTERLDAAADREAAVARAVELLLASEVVALPTDTVYGVAVHAFDSDATDRLRAVKERDRTVPFPVLVHSPKQLAGLAAGVPTAAEHLMAAFWPGPLTLVLHAQARLSWDLGETEVTVSVRMPLEETTLEVIRGVGPLAVTGANAPGLPAPEDADGVLTQLGDQLAAVLDGGPCPGGGVSTIVDLTRARPAVLREGVLPTELVLDVAEGRLAPLDAAARLLGEEPADAPEASEPADAPEDDTAAVEISEPPAPEDEQYPG